MANNQRLIIVIAVIASILAVIAIVALLVSTNTSQGNSVAGLASPTSINDENALRTKIYGEQTGTAIMDAATNQASTIVAMQQTMNAPTQEPAIQQPVVATVLQTQVVQVTVPPQQVVVVATAMPATALPQPTAIPATQVRQQIMSPSLDWSSFRSQTDTITDPYQLIDWLNNRPEKIDNPGTNYQVQTGDDEAVILWTGLYVDDTTLGGSVVPYRVDGKTGVWLILPGSSVTVPTSGGTIRMTTIFSDECPATPQWVALLVGGDYRRWHILPNSNNTGWQYGAGAPPVTLRAPSFGKIDYWNNQSGTIRNGQTANNVTEASFWCAG